MKLNINVKSYLLLIFMILPFLTNAQGFSWAQGFAATSSGSGGAGVKVVDNSNNVYCVGGFTGTIDVDKSANTYNLTSVGHNNMVVLKENAAGNLIWAKHFPCKSPVNVNFGFTGTVGMSLDTDGNIYIAGTFSDTMDFDPGPGTFYMQPPMGIAINFNTFIVKLNPNGDFIWAKQIGGTAGTSATFRDMEMNNSGMYLLIASGTGIVDVDPDTGVVNMSGGILLKLDTGGHYVWARNGYGGVAFVMDSLNNFYFTGAFSGTIDFDPDTSTVNLTSTGGDDIFIQKIDSVGHLQWVEQIGSGYYYDEAFDISIDKWGNVAVTGCFGGTVDFDPGPAVYNLTSNSTRSIFTLKLRNNGDFAWAQKAGYNTGLYEGRGITTDTAGNVYVISYAYPIQKFDSSGNLLWTLATAGTTGWITLDNNNSIYLSGSFIGGNVDFDPGPGFYGLTAASPGGGFILKLCQNTPASIPLTASEDTVCAGDTVWLTTPVVPGATRYYWQQNGTYFNDTNTIAVTASGNYKVTVYGGECPWESNVVNVFVAPIGNSSLTLSAPASAPPGQGVTVNAALTDPGSNYTIDWYRNGVLLTTNAAPSYSFAKTAVDDTVYAVLRPQAICYDTAVMSDTVILLTEKTDTSTAAAHLSLHATHIYPNPFDNTLTVSGLQPGDKIWLLDATGRVLLRKEAVNISENIDMKELAAGYYIIKLYTKEGNVKGNVPVEKR